jgi:hypothetical protein
LLGVLQQREQAVAQKIARRFVAGIQEEDGVGEQLVDGQSMALVLSQHERAEQVLAGRAPDLLDLALEIGPERLDALEPARKLVGGDVGVEVQGDDREVVAPILDLLAVLLGHTHELGDDENGGAARRSPR